MVKTRVRGGKKPSGKKKGESDSDQAVILWRNGRGKG